MQFHSRHGNIFKKYLPRSHAFNSYTVRTIFGSSKNSERCLFWCALRRHGDRERERERERDLLRLGGDQRERAGSANVFDTFSIFFVRKRGRTRMPLEKKQ